MIPVLSQSRRVWRAVSAAFSPLSIPGCALWLKADSLALSDGDPVSTWGDSSGNGNDAVQGDESLRPVFAVNGVNSKPAVRFAGASGTYPFLQLGYRDIYGFSAGSISMVVKNRNAVPDKGGWYWFGTEYVNCHPYTNYHFFDDFFSTVRKDFEVLDDLSLQFNLYSVRSKADQWDAKLNGTNRFSTTTNTVALPNYCSIGGQSFGYNLDGDIAEVIVYGSYLSDPDLASVESYLKSKYAI